MQRPVTGNGMIALNRIDAIGRSDFFVFSNQKPAGFRSIGTRRTGLSLLNEQHLAISRQRPEVVGHNSFQFVRHLRTSSMAGTTVTRKSVGRHDVRDDVVPAMLEVRKVADELEGIVADDLWPLPTYREMLFIK